MTTASFILLCLSFSLFPSLKYVAVTVPTTRLTGIIWQLNERTRKDLNTQTRGSHSVPGKCGAIWRYYTIIHQQEQVTSGFTFVHTCFAIFKVMRIVTLYTTYGHHTSGSAFSVLFHL